ncbi:hypothetical protein Q5752_004714 [Cryptotrichosporon argae]
MRPTSSVFGASRLPLTPKRGNKDFYKGTRQAYVPGGGHRTGPPGKHVVRGKAKYRVVDEQVRYFVGPGAEALRDTPLKPYVEAGNETLVPALSTRLPSFSPNALPRPGALSLARPDYTRFSKAYGRLTAEEKQALNFEARRRWWAAMLDNFGEDVPRPGAETGAAAATVKDTAVNAEA